jgi:hypothetical protein
LPVDDPSSNVACVLTMSIMNVRCHSLLSWLVPLTVHGMHACIYIANHDTDGLVADQCHQPHTHTHPSRLEI